MTGDRNAAIDRFATDAVAAARKGRQPSTASLQRLVAELRVAQDPYEYDDDEGDDAHPSH